MLDAARPNGRVIVFHNRLPYTFHPKVYLFKSPGAAELLIDSGNLTEGGLFTNYEVFLRLTLDLADPNQATILQSIEHVLDIWADTSSGTSHVLDEDLLARLMSLGFVPSEALAAPETEGATMPPTSVAGMESDMDTGEELGPECSKFLFVARAEPRPPPFPRSGVSHEKAPVTIIKLRQNQAQLADEITISRASLSS